MPDWIIKRGRRVKRQEHFVIEISTSDINDSLLLRCVNFNAIAQNNALNDARPTPTRALKSLTEILLGAYLEYFPLKNNSEFTGMVY